MYEKKLFVAVFAALLAVSCQKKLFQGVPRYMREYPAAVDGERPPRRDSMADETPDSTGMVKIYTSAIRYPSEAVLLCDGREIAAAASDGNPDRIRIRKGHLWNDFLDGQETVMLKDGREILRYCGNEFLTGFVQEGDSIYTLGQRAGGEGFCLRLNGEPLVEKSSGVTIGSLSHGEWDGGALTKEGSSLYYSYGITVSSASGSVWEYYIMDGKDIFETVNAGSLDLVWDIRVSGGMSYIAGRRTGSRLTSCLIAGGKVLSIGITQQEYPVDMRIVPFGEDISVKGYSRLPMNLYMAWYRSKDGLLASAVPPSGSPLLYADPDGKATLMTKDGLITQVFINERECPIEAGKYRLASSSCATFRDGVFYAALTGADSLSHAILRDTVLTTVSFPGFFTSIKVE